MLVYVTPSIATCIQGQVKALGERGPDPNIFTGPLAHMVRNYTKPFN